MACVGESMLANVAACSGKVLNTANRICPLHPFRFGKNPNRPKSKKVWTEEEKEVFRQRLTAMRQKRADNCG